MRRPSFADCLLYRLRRAGINQLELARRVGVHPSAVTRWIKEQSTPTLENLQKVAEALGTDLSSFWRVPRAA